MMIKFLIIKEFKQFFRNPFLPKLIVIFPIMIMLVIPWIMTMDIKNIRLAVVDTDGSSMSGKFIQKIDASGYFILRDVSANYNESMEQLMLNKVDAIIEIPDYFEEQLIMTGQSPMQISINAVNQIKGTLGSGYINAVCGDFYTENLSYLYKDNPERIPKVSISVLNKFNPYGEKEKGTIEQINITPVRKTSFIFAKLIPYWVMGLIVLSICMLLAWAVYGLSPHGGIWTVYLFSLLFIFALSGFGLIVSNYSDTMQQAMFVMFFFILVFMDERTAHPHILHAPVGAGHHLAEPSEILH